jgi:mRNA interferase YafQ
MKEIITSNRFKRDYKSAAKRNLDLDRLREVIELLASGSPSPTRSYPHKLKGNYVGFWECHIEPDWLLIYKIQGNVLELAATGTHADLFR